MSAIKAVFRNGQIVPREPVTWPEGMELLVEPAFPGISEADWPTTPAGIDQHLALMDQIEPLDMTPDEERAWQAARDAQKHFEKALFAEHAESLRRMWE